MVIQLSLFDPIEIPLTQGYVALVDPIDADLAQYKWSVFALSRRNRTSYAQRTTGATRLMHRIILERILGRALEQSEIADHIDGNGLNNCRSNLRVASRSENSHNSQKSKNNTSGYKGVYWNNSHQRWCAQIKCNNVRVFHGYFATREEAHAAYCEAADKYHGEFARSK